MKIEFKSQVTSLEKRIDGLEETNKQQSETIAELQEKLSNIENYSRRSNLIFEGFPESPNEDLQAKLGSFIKNALKVSGNIEFSRIHRIGKPPHLVSYTSNKPRPIIARFHFYPDRDRIWKASWSLKHSTYRVNEDFSETVKENRRVLLPVFKAAKQERTVRKCSLRADKLVIDVKTFTTSNLDNLPDKLVWAAKGERFIPQVNSTFFFGQQSFLSNFHPAPFEDEGRSFSCSEQFYLYHKSMHFDDDSTALAILRTKDPHQMKRLSHRIRNFDSSKWSRHARPVMEKACLLKFSQNTLLADKLLLTQGSLVEANRNDKFFSCGLGLSDPNVIEESRWEGQNILGQILVDLRNRLRNKTKISSESSTL